MRMGRPIAALKLSAEERQQLESLSHSRSLPHALVQRAQIILASATGEPNSAIAKRMKLSNATVGKWRRRYSELRIEGLHDELRPGRPRALDDERVAEVINTALQSMPPDATQWSVRTMEGHTGVSKSTVQRWFNLFGVQPHRQRNFKLSNDPFFVEKVRDIVGLYLNPPDHAVVLCVDEKTQIQALQRTQPLLPMGLGYVTGVTHDYIRHGTTTLFAALDVANGAIVTQCKQRHRHQEFLAFLRHIDNAVPKTSTSISSSTTTPPTNTPRSKRGWHGDRVITSTTRPPTRPGSIRSNAGSASLPSRPSAADRSPTSKNSSKKSRPPFGQFIGKSLNGLGYLFGGNQTPVPRSGPAALGAPLPVGKRVQE